jgi:AcrR family transcriptional regulator
VAIAMRMFAERGYEDTSIEAVLREAGVSRGSLYHHFASKEAPFEAVAEELETSIGAQTMAAASAVPTPLTSYCDGYSISGLPALGEDLQMRGLRTLGA